MRLENKYESQVLTELTRNKSCVKKGTGMYEIVVCCLNALEKDIDKKFIVRKETKDKFKQSLSNVGFFLGNGECTSEKSPNTMWSNNNYKSLGRFTDVSIETYGGEYDIVRATLCLNNKIENNKLISILENTDKDFSLDVIFKEDTLGLTKKSNVFNIEEFKKISINV